MGLWSTIRDALGLQRPLPRHDATAPLALSDAAMARLEALPPGQGLHVETVEVPGGRRVQITEGASQGPAAPGLEAWRLTASDADLERLRGRTLDLHEGRWVISVPLELRARETPNPNGRMYLSSQVLCTGRPAFFTGTVPVSVPNALLPARLLAIEGITSVLLRDNTVTIERTPGVPWSELDRAVDEALREHLLLCGGPVDGDQASAAGGGGELFEAIEQVIAAQIAPAIHRDGGDIELLGVSDGVVTVALNGACRSCPASALTLKGGVERTLREAFPGQIERVEQV
ncbi:MAG TPA: hypothetical protein ENK18_14595 [Deltaproteobacteria bacterium]|nr:hypothetical protein [Deltaproteobacteria bacterium]